MTDLDAILATVLAEPECDTARLVYADAMEETGETLSVARAEFIRVQCELASAGLGKPLTLQSASLELLGGTGRTWKAVKLLNRYGSIWLGNLLFDAPIRDVCEWGWSRGFIHTVRGRLDVLRSGRCLECAGDGTSSFVLLMNPPLGQPCPACHGTGTTPGILAALVRREPVERVEVIGIAPVPVHMSGGYRPLSWTPDQLPPDLLEQVRQQDLHFAETPGGPGSYLAYEGDMDAVDAHAALSRALIAEAKGL